MENDHGIQSFERQLMKIGRWNVGQPNPALKSPAGQVVSRHSFVLNRLGQVAVTLIWVSAAFHPGRVSIAIAFALFIGLAILKGKEYRQNLKAILEEYSGWGVLLLLVQSWRFWIAVALMDAIVVGLLNFDQIMYFKNVYLASTVGLVFFIFLR